jgi:hypothetical protein
MLALLRKDLPWILFFVVAGWLTVLGAVLFADPVDLLMFDYATAEATWWTALFGGLALGATAGLFDELLGARELLLQRPIAAKRILFARIASVVTVLATWHLAIPVLLLLWWPFASAEGLSWSLGAWAEHNAALAVAWPAAAIMMSAFALPLGWPLRLVAAAAALYPTFALLDFLTKGGGTASHDAGSYTLACGVAAALFFSLAWLTGVVRADADRPLVQQVPRLVAQALVMVVAGVWCCGTIEMQSAAVASLQNAYPEPRRRGTELVLVTTEPRTGDRFVVDAEHKVIEPAQPGDVDLDWSAWRPFPPRDNEFDRPNFVGRGQATLRVGNGELHLRHDGALWLEQRPEWRVRKFEQLVKSAEQPNFAANALLLADSGDLDSAVVVEPLANHVWSYDAAAKQMVALTLPDGDRVGPGHPVGVVQLADLGPDPMHWRAFLTAAEYARADQHTALRCVVGERAAYRLVAGRLETLPLAVVPGGRSWLYAAEDPIEFTRSVAATTEHGAFAHDLRPRTARERWRAGLVYLWSTLRPPVLQVVAHSTAAIARPGWLFDAVVAAGRRPWLVLVQVGFGLLLAASVLAIGRWRAGRRSWWWAAQAALFGVPAWLLFLLLERRRRWQQLDVPAPPALRISAASARASAT